MAIAASLGGATAAQADPMGEPFPVACDNGNTYLVTVNGNGAFTPAHDINSTAVLIPTAFGEIHIVVTDAAGNVLDEFTDPPITKTSRTNDLATATSCTFNQVFLDGDVTITVTGSVTGFVTPVR